VDCFNWWLLTTSSNKLKQVKLKKKGNNLVFAALFRAERIMWEADMPEISFLTGEIKSSLSELHGYGRDNWVAYAALFPFKVAVTLAIIFLIALLGGMYMMIVSLLWLLDGENVGEWVDQAGITHLPTFYSPSDNDVVEEEDASGISAIIIFFVASVFGGLHCVGWNFHFPSHSELIIWRVSSLFITLMPTASVITIIFATLVEQHENYRDILILCFFSLVILYIPARSILLIESFTTLRNLPQKAILDLDWSSFIPHF